MLCCAATAAQAIAFGRISSTTFLGQPLNFVAYVRMAADESLTAECVSAEVFAGENKVVQQLITVQLEPADYPAERRVRVRTTSPIDEPVVTVNLSLGCVGTSTRKFVAFVDPPGMNLAQAGSVGSAVPEARAPSDAAATAVAAAPAAATAAAETVVPSVAAPAAVAARPRPRRAGPPRVSKRPSTSTTVAAAPKPRRTSSATGAGASARAPAGPVSRLKLEAAPEIQIARAPTVAEPPAAPSAAPAASPASAPASGPVDDRTAAEAAAAAERLAKESARLQALEESLKRVRDETQAAQKTLAALQARIREAEAQRYANPLVYALAAISALLALAVAGLWWRQVRAQREAKWWGTVAPSMAAASELPETADERESRFAEVSAPAELPKPSAKVITAPAPAPAIWADSRQTEPAPDLVPEPRRDLSVEELIDLEQQAEFFVVLGQDDAAIDLLMGHVRSTGGISPLPYLKLLEIYRRRGDRSAYERIRERFNRRFNAYAPDWDADLQQGRSLEDYPATIARLEALWVMPQRVMETLEASLFRRDETEEAFDLPAYRELLFLYAVARDFAHRADDSSAVDLLLPMDTDAPSAPVSRLVASLPGALERSSLAQPTKAAGDGEPPATEPEPEPPAAVSQADLSLELGPLELDDDATKPGKVSRR
jgi:pilus assembly protein FimV